MGRLIMCIIAPILMGCVGPGPYLSQVDQEAMYMGALCYEAATGDSYDDWPDPKFRVVDTGGCPGGAVACAQEDMIKVDRERWAKYDDRPELQTAVLAHEYLHVLYWDMVDPSHHHAHWAVDFDRPECYNIPYRSIWDTHNGEEQ